MYIGPKLFEKLFEQNGRHPRGITPNNQQLVVPTTMQEVPVINLINSNIEECMENTNTTLFHLILLSIYLLSIIIFLEIFGKF